jgi:tripartite ATP-independent transporter DctM subunit
MWAIGFLAFLVVGVPIPVAIGIAATLAISFTDLMPMSSVATLMFNGVANYTMVAIPLFMMAGLFMSSGSIAQRIFDLARELVGWTRGSMGHVNVVASMIFGGISGSSLADTAGLGPIEMEAMKKFGYPDDYSAAITVASSTLAVMIPPSLVLVFYAIVAEQSVGACLLAGLLPGIMVGFSLMLVNAIYARKFGWDAANKFSWRSLRTKASDGFWAVVAPLFILMAILTGWVTATEAAALTVIYCLLIEAFVFKTLDRSQMLPTILVTGRRVGAVLLSVACGSLVSVILTMENTPVRVAKAVTELTSSPLMILVLVNIILLIAGCFMDNVFIILVFVPLLLPLMKAIGVHPIHFGVIVTVNTSIGLLTPPVGGCLFVIMAVTKIPMERIVRALLPFLLVLVVDLLLLTYVADISMVLPNIYLSLIAPR